MLFLYNFFILFLTVLLSPWLLFKLAADRRFRAGIAERLGFIPRNILDRLEGQHPIWFHAASVGEVSGAARLLEEIRKRWPEKKLLVSTFTATGKGTAMERLDADGVIMLPIDLPFVAARVVKRIKPSILVVMETELWPNLIDSTAEMGIPVVLVNGRISGRSFGRYMLTKPLLKRVFDGISLLLMRSEEDRGRIVALGAPPDKIKITGNIKFNLALRDNKAPFMESWGGPVLIAGSTRTGEEAIILDIYLRLQERHASLRLILAPRHIERTDDVKRLLEDAGISFILRSRVKKTIPDNISVLLLDTLGELASLYRYGDVVFVGGSLVPKGGHNILEPALYGRPVLFGPYMDDFAEEAEILSKGGGGVRVNGADGLEEWLGRLLSDNKLRSEMGSKAAESVTEYQGATERTLSELAAFIDRP